MLSSSPDTFKHSWFSVKKFQTIHLSTTGTYKLNRYPVGEKKMHGNIFKDITFLVAYQWNLILPFVTYWALFVLQTKQSLYAFACFCRLKPLRKHYTVGQLQEGESNLKDIYPVQSCPLGHVKKLLELTEPLFYLGKAPILWSTDVDKMGLFLMGPTLSPCYQPGGGGAATSARDAAGPADTDSGQAVESNSEHCTGGDSLSVHRPHRQEESP